MRNDVYSVLRAAIRAADKFCRDRRNGALRPRREWKAGRPEAIAAALRFLTYRNPDVHGDDDRLVWHTADATVTVPADEAFDTGSITDVLVTIAGPDGPVSIRLQSPADLASAVLSAWMTLDTPEDYANRAVNR